MDSTTLRPYAFVLAVPVRRSVSYVNHVLGFSPERGDENWQALGC